MAFANIEILAVVNQMYLCTAYMELHVKFTVSICAAIVIGGSIVAKTKEKA